MPAPSESPIRQAAGSPAISLVLFDMDDVLARLDRPRRLRWLADATGKPPELFQTAIFSSDFEVGAEAGDHPTGEAYLAEFNRRTGCALAREQWVEARRQAMTVIPGTLAIIRELRVEARVAVLTNNGSLLQESFAQLLPEAAALFGDQVYASYQFRARKPDPELYRRCLAHLGAAPAATVFVDDAPGNVQGAIQAGLHGIVFQSPEQLRLDLRALGLLRR